MRPFWRTRWARKTCWARRRATGWRAAWRARGSVARATGRRTDPLAPAPWIGRRPKALELLDKRVKTRRRPRPEERRVGKERVSTLISRGSQHHYKKKRHRNAYNTHLILT